MPILSKKRSAKLKFYSKAFAQQFFVPNVYFRGQLEKKLNRISAYNTESIYDRVDYYNKFESTLKLSADAVCLESIPSTRQTAYYYDLRAILRYFPKNIRVSYEFGDVRVVKSDPSLVKSRPISDENNNNILMRFNQVRHFVPILDKTPYSDKKDILVWRGAGWQQTRRVFLKEFWNHPLCDIGQVNPPCEIMPPECVKPVMTIDEQLRYKFILSLEGTDVATNLKWIAQSNSLCFMRKPRMESWFMEGRLLGGVHYVELRDDYADLSEKMEYYKKNPEVAKSIIQNFQNYYRQFSDPKREELISLLVVQKYLRLAGVFVVE